MHKKLISDSRLILLQKRLHSHPIYNSLKTQDHIKLFMERHCFAVWDFFLLVKDLQRDLTNTKRFWTPCEHPNVARSINEIVIGEETDITPVPGEHGSHFELYLKAMKELNANTQPIDNFINEVRKLSEAQSTYAAIEKLVLEADTPAYVKKFNLCTIKAILHPNIGYTAGQFFFGREDPIPQMFTKFVKTLDQGKIDCPTLKFYLQRHIDLDGGEHGPMAIMVLQRLIAGDETNFKHCLDGAYDSIEHRLLLWDGILEDSKQSTKGKAANVV